MISWWVADLFGNGIKVIGTTDHSFLERLCGKMVGVAQLAERKNVALQVAGSSPVTHPLVDANANRCLQVPQPHFGH